MNASEIIKNIEAEQLKAEAPQFSVGDTVKVYGKIKEGNRERIQVFEGTVIKKQGGSNRTTFTVRKISNGVGVEKTWPLHSPNVEKVEIVRKGKVRRAKLYGGGRAFRAYVRCGERAADTGGYCRLCGSPSGSSVPGLCGIGQRHCLPFYARTHQAWGSYPGRCAGGCL